MTADIDSSRLLFVGGLHRSGTTLLTRWLAQHPDVSGFSATSAGWGEDEGQHLQDVIPPARDFGGPGRFAFDARAALTESSPLVSGASRERMLEQWSPWWDLERRVLVEKSPPNLIRTRFLQALFPEATFLVVIRHPVATAYATQKWTRTPLASLIRHWLVAHERFAADAERLRRVTLVRYEDLVMDPDGVLGTLFAGLGLPAFAGDWEVRLGLNEAYLARWRPGRNPAKVARAALLARRFEGRVAAFGYSLRDVDALLPPSAVSVCG